VCRGMVTAGERVRAAPMIVGPSSHRGKLRMTIEDTERIARLLKPVSLCPLPERPFVSVLIAHYNYEDYIGQAIESVLGQSYRDFELVICDDGSTDNSPSIIESYARRDSRIQSVRQANAGVGSSTNTAYSLSKGEIICFLDADDRYLPGKLQTVVEAFRSHPESGLLFHRVFLMDKTGSRTGLAPLTKLLPSGWYGPFVLRNGGLPASGGPPTSSGRCMRREICELIFPVPVELTRYADAVIAEQAVLRTSIVSVCQPLAEYRIHGSNLAATSGVTLEYVDRELRIQKENWAINRKYLEKTDPVLARAFAPFERYPMSLMLTYIGARLGQEQNCSEAYQRLVDGEGFAAISKVSQYFWRLSILLPRWLFVMALGFVWGSNPLKQWVARFSRNTRSVSA
jgi:glycosyltransferase involved in cell wall biosynthesis